LKGRNQKKEKSEEKGEKERRTKTVSGKSPPNVRFIQIALHTSCFK